MKKTASLALMALLLLPSSGLFAQNSNTPYGQDKTGTVHIPGVPAGIAYALLNAPDKNGKTPLMVAAEQGDLAEVKRLISKKVYISTEDKKEGRTALSFAAEAGHADVVKALLQGRCPNKC